MIIFPAIDIYNGQCVRLYKGDYSTASKVADNPLETAKRFEKEGAVFLHMVDLNGAKEAKRINGRIFEEAASLTSFKIQLCGGSRRLAEWD